MRLARHKPMEATTESVWTILRRISNEMQLGYRETAVHLFKRGASAIWLTRRGRVLYGTEETYLKARAVRFKTRRASDAARAYADDALLDCGAGPQRAARAVSVRSSARFQVPLLHHGAQDTRRAAPVPVAIHAGRHGW